MHQSADEALASSQQRENELGRQLTEANEQLAAAVRVVKKKIEVSSSLFYQ